MTGGPARFTVHTYEADPKKISAKSGAQALIRAGNEVHFTLNPLTGEFCQILPASRAGRGLVNKSGGVETNRFGTRNIQIEVIAFAKSPFTSYMTAKGWASWTKIMNWVASHNVTRAWPSGPPPAYPSGSDERSVAIWKAKSGLYGHSQVPENSHGDPGKVDATKLAQAGAGGGSVTLTPAEVLAIAVESAKQTWTRFKVYDKANTGGEGDDKNQVSLQTGLSRTLQLSRSTVEILNTQAVAIAALQKQVTDLTALVKAISIAGVDTGAVAKATCDEQDKRARARLG
jgi:hypothetical protein